MRIGHPSHRQLLRLCDDELPPGAAARVLAHLDRCSDCRAQLTCMQEVLSLSGARPAPLFADHEEARGRLQTRLAAAALQNAPARWHWQWMAAFALALLAAVIWLPRRHRPTPAMVDGGLLPNPILTPGATQQVMLKRVCSSNPPINAAVPVQLQQRVLREYGVAGSNLASFEVDYLITPGLGGTADIRNLWPEPRSHATWNSYVKDQLERYLQQSVCRGEVPLAAAQNAIASNWINAYKLYFHTDRPQPISRPADGAAPHIALLIRPYI